MNRWLVMKVCGGNGGFFLLIDFIDRPAKDTNNPLFLSRFCYSLKYTEADL